jgi:hypothetical protein
LGTAGIALALLVDCDATAQVAAPKSPLTLQTQFARLQIDDKGFVTSLASRPSGREYSPAAHPSPLLSLHEHGQPNDQLMAPAAAEFSAERLTLKYSNGAEAVVTAAAKDGYFRFQLLSLTPRGEVDNIVWGPLNTTIAGTIGDIIGVVRSEDWAIGLLGLDDNTIAGSVVDSDCYQMGYHIHSPDPVNRPVPSQFNEGQWFSVGGDGISDTAFFSHPEEYFQYVCGTGAKLEPAFGSSIAYHARDRRRSYVHFWSLLPGFERSRPRHMMSDPVPGVDLIGSAVALYACPDDQGLATIENIILAEGLPHITDRDGEWVRDPAAWRPTVYWSGPVDKAIEYTKALGLKDISRDTGEFYASLDSKWVGRVGFSDGKTVSYREFAEEAHRQGLTHGGLHTLCVFLQGGVSRDVTPVPSEHLQTVCRTKLAQDISATDTNLVVTDPSFLAEKGTWPWGDDSNYLRIGGEMLWYAGISDRAPWTLQGVKRGHGSKAVAHQAGDEVVKLMQNCYNGFVPDMELLLDYADYYADLMHRNGMDTINFDGFESTVYQNHGYYGVRVFCRRLFEAYHKLTGGKWPRVTGSNVFPGAWEYFNVCDLGAGDHMFNAVTGHRAIEGKDIGNGWSNSYYPGTFGIQGWHSDWSLYDAENLEAKAIGWDATYAFSISQDVIDRTGERDAIFKAFRAWQNTRAQTAFTKAQKLKLRDPDHKFHLEQTGPKKFVLYPITELRFSGNASVTNSHVAQPLQFALRLVDPADGVNVTLPDGSPIKSEATMEAGQFIICWGDRAYLADKFRKKLAPLPMDRPATLPAGESKFDVRLSAAAPSANARFTLTVWTFGESEVIE